MCLQGGRETPTGKDLIVNVFDGGDAESAANAARSSRPELRVLHGLALHVRSGEPLARLQSHQHYEVDDAVRIQVSHAAPPGLDGGTTRWHRGRHVLYRLSLIHI